jgi:hypothetical protein
MVRTFFFNQNDLIKSPTPDFLKPPTVEFPWLAPKPLSQLNTRNKSVVEIPSSWLGFFQALLMAPAQHEWAKHLLQSNFAQQLQGDSEWPTWISLTKKPIAGEACSLLNSEPPSVKIIEENIQEENLDTGSPGKKKSKKEKPGTPVVDSVVRRSTRVRANSNGFKVSICKTKNCLGCSSAPPTLSQNVIRKIGTSMCQLWDDQLEDHVLLGKKMEPVGKKAKKSKKDEADKKGTNREEKDREENEDK